MKIWIIKNHPWKKHAYFKRVTLGLTMGAFIFGYGIGVYIPAKGEV